MYLVAAVSVPLSLLGAGSLWVQYGAARQRAEGQLVAQARTMARLVDRAFERAGTVAEMLAGSTVLARGDLDAFEREMRAAALMLSADLPPGAGQVLLRLVRADGVRLLDTSWALGERREEPALVLPHLVAALKSQRVEFSDLFIAQRRNLPLVAVAAPVRDGRFSGEATIGIGVPVLRFEALLAAAGLQAEGSAVVLDRRGSAVATTTRGALRPDGHPWRMEEMPGESGLLPGRPSLPGGASFATAYARAPDSGFVVRLDVPEKVFLEPLQGALLRSLLLGALVLAGGLLVAWALARHVVAAFRRVPRLALAKAGGGVGEDGRAATGLREADELVVTLAGTLGDRLKAEAALLDSEARFRTLADAMPPMVWSALPDGQHDYFNARWQEFTGIGEGGAGWLGMIHPEDMAPVAGRWARSLRTGEPYEMEFRLRRRDGTYRWALSRALPVRDAEGHVLRWFGATTDIQEIVEAREVVARDRAELEELVRERTRDLEATQERLAQAQRMQALGQLAGGIAHDFNNVLQAVQGGAVLIERRPGDRARVARLGRMIVEASERGTIITRRLLTFARRGALRAEAVDAGALLADMREILLHTLGQGITVELSIAGELPPLFVDKGQLETVLVNLGTNARDAMEGSGSLVLAAAVEAVEEGLEHPAGLGRGVYVRISVTDTGPGMDAATMARATEPFFTTKPVGKGTGLGLSMAKGFAEQSGGGMTIESAPGRGTAIHLLFPRAETGVSDASPTVAAVTAPSGRRDRARLLLVDDDAAVREVTAEQLESHGYVVRTASSGAAALGLLEEGWEAELVVSDLSMPGMDWLALIREVQRRWPGMPAILLTGFVSNAAAIAIGGALSGGFSLLNKPVDGQRLAERVAVLLEGATTAS